MPAIVLFALLASGPKEVISGRVLLPDGSPAVSASVSLQTSDPDGWQFRLQTRTRKDGTFKMAVRDLNPGESSIVIRRPGFVMAVVDLDRQNSTGDVQLRTGGKVNAQFIGPNRLPVQGSTIRVREVIHRLPDGKDVHITTAPELAMRWKTDMAGSCVLTDLPPGDEVRLEVQDDRCARLSDMDSIHVDPDGKPMTIRYEMGLAAFISGRVRMDGHPVEGIRVVATSTKDPGTTVETRSNYVGMYRITTLPAGSYTVQAFLPNDLAGERTATAREKVEIRSGFFQSAVDFNLVVGQTICGTVMDSEGRPVVNEYVNFYGPAHPKAVSTPGTVRTDEFGRYKIRVPVGEQEVWLRSKSDSLRTVMVNKGETKTIDLVEGASSK